MDNKSFIKINLEYGSLKDLVFALFGIGVTLFLIFYLPVFGFLSAIMLMLWFYCAGALVGMNVSKKKGGN